MWKFIVDVVQDFVSSLQPDVGRGSLHVSNVFLLVFPIDIENKSTIENINSYIYIQFLASYFRDPSCWKQWYIEIYRVGYNWRTVNTLTSPHISGQLGTNNPC